MSALSFKQVIAGSAPACATKFFAPDAGGTARGLQSRFASFESGPGCHWRQAHKDEHATLNREVAGSIPAAPTKFCEVA